MFISIYLLVLTLVPCGDAFAHDDSLSLTEKIEIPTAQHTDICSSLCSCACCGQITYQTEESVFSFDIQEYFKKIIIHYQENFTSNFSGFVWQPPKLLNHNK